MPECWCGGRDGESWEVAVVQDGLEFRRFHLGGINRNLLGDQLRQVGQTGPGLRPILGQLEGAFRGGLEISSRFQQRGRQPSVHSVEQRVGFDGQEVVNDHFWHFDGGVVGREGPTPRVGLPVLQHGNGVHGFRSTGRVFDHIRGEREPVHGHAIRETVAKGLLGIAWFHVSIGFEVGRDGFIGWLVAGGLSFQNHQATVGTAEDRRGISNETSIRQGWAVGHGPKHANHPKEVRQRTVDFWGSAGGGVHLGQFCFLHFRGQ